VRPNQSVPPATVVPILIYPDVRTAVAWLVGAFGFRERVRIGESHRAQLSIGTDGAVIVAPTSFACAWKMSNLTMRVHWTSAHGCLTDQ